MQVSINGSERELERECSVSQLLQILEITSKRLAIELNGNIIPRSQFDSHKIQAGDTIEIVQAIGGG